MGEKIRLGIVGCGSFVQAFIPLFKAHPYVESVAVTDLIKERREGHAKKFGITRVFDSYEEMLKSNVNAIAVFVQRELHGPITIAALKAGKNVYSAVPVATSIEEIRKIAELVKETRLTFSMGETGYYRPCSVFCRNMTLKGEFGDFVYGESQYNHDMRHFYEHYQRSGGPDWKKVAGLPPMYYPTHSTAMMLSSTCSHAVRVSAFGFVEKQDADMFGTGMNYWDNPFSNTTAILKLANGGIARINENRRIAWYGPMSYISSFHGTKASYEFSMANHSYVKLEGMAAVHEDISARLNPPDMELHRPDPDFYNGIVNGKWSGTLAPVQDAARLPDEYKGLHDGHGGTHKFMADDFCKAAYTGKLSPTNIWTAARFNIPGLIAHESALRDGESMAVPDLGEPPADWPLLDPADKN